MPRKVTPDELLDMMREGAIVTKEDRPRIIEGFADLIAEMQKLVKAQQDIADKQAAGLADAVDKITKALQDGRVDMDRIERILTAALPTRDARRDPAAYKFNMERDGNGDLSAITATPVVETRH